MMRPHVELVTMTALELLTRVADGITTHMATPDLARELNPLASGGWPALIAAALAVVAGSTCLHAQYLFRPVDNFPSTAAMDLRAFKRHYFDPKENATLREHPWRVAAYVFGYVTPRTLILWTLLLIANNLATAAPVESYVELKRQYPVWIAFYAALPLIAVLLVERLQQRDFARYRGTRHGVPPPGQEGRKAVP
ncbi:MAG: hypothetical protein ONB48_03715 [candidate division KSB1 bacterium]|nr:hypothetical protein [candidate division KSB1 bacterium]MDZ7274582.1 hypothetical protein [candidate division KSB1 bacterium]MDZ7284757.1 hypothetical protein [candidate division KSB1 bacterium]MDZ7297823.1 hypothetical protein [candidate division KSB1 bacterium]MDZ7307787.1 hypothetical protein [candidate division KSB1 bacterium]